MKINKPTGTPLINPYQKQQYITHADKLSQAKKKDQVQISDQAKAMLESKTHVDPARQEKVKQLKQQIQNGEYKVDSHKVAERMYQFWFGNE